MTLTLDEVITRLRGASFDLGWADPADAANRGYLPPTWVEWETQSWVPKVSATPGTYDNPRFRPYVCLGNVARGRDAYGQTSTVHRSNYRSLRRDFPQVPWVDVSYVNVDSLGVFCTWFTEDAECGPDLLDILCKLATEYPVFDEDDMSSLEHDEIGESWGYMAWDLRHELEDTPAADVWDYIGDTTVQDLFWEAMSAGAFGNYPEHNGLEVVWGDIADRARDFAPVLVNEGAKIGGHVAPGQMAINESGVD